MRNFRSDKAVLCAGALMPDFVIPLGDARNYMAIVSSGDWIEPRKSGIHLRLGGTSGNTAFGLAQLDIPTMVLAKVGNDYLGNLLKEDMTANGVNAECVRFDPNRPTMMNVAVIAEAGDRYMFTWPDKESSLWNIRPEDIPNDVLSGLGWVQFCGATLENNPAADTLGGLAERCFDAGIPVSVDLNVRTECFGWSPEYRTNIQRVIEVSSVVFGSLHEEYPFFTPDPRQLVTDDRMIVTRDGRNGCVLFTADGDYSLGIYEVPVVDTVGAGDVFNSGFIAAAMLGMTPRECLLWGNACGNYSVQFEGGHSCPSRSVLLQFLEQNPGSTPLSAPSPQNRI